MTNELLKYYQCVGTLFGLSILNNMPIPIHFPRYLYKKLLNKPIVLADLALFNPALYASLRAIQNGSVPIYPSVDFIYIDDLANYLIDLTNFCDTTDDKDFIPKPVTDENKNEFIENLLTWVFEKSCSQAFHAFEEGIKKDNANQMLFTNFSCGEIDEIIIGNAPFNWDDLKKGAKYSEPYDTNNKVISWFWKYFEQLDEDQKLNVLKFITGSTSIPKGGLKYIHITFNPSDSEIPKADSDQQEIQLPQYRIYDANNKM
ncbi:putative E3 ubiquitin-protein ligase herc4 [Tritrichomonas musculus]|uniref:HECT-type E3 ubiquitin transferase n=1 Tax=Tritrichomonas musculus TaxID=1915356 RepID=A0ABR2KIR5_9EUKA